MSAWPDSGWQRLIVTEGEKGPLIYDWACQRVVEAATNCRALTAGCWCGVRLAITAMAFCVECASGHPLLKLAQVAATRYTVQQCIEEARARWGSMSMRCVTGTVGTDISRFDNVPSWLASIRSQASKKGGRDRS